MYNFAKTIDDAIEECKENGSSSIVLNDNITIEAEWEEWEQDSNFDVVTIYILENDIIKFSYQVPETKIKN